MKKWNIFINILIFVSLGLWVIQALLSYHNYTRHVALYAANGWEWYTDVLSWGKCIVPIVIVLLIVKFVIHKKRKN